MIICFAQQHVIPHWAGGFLFLLMPKKQSTSLGRFKMVQCALAMGTSAMSQ
jgi:hypothetical protein